MANILNKDDVQPPYLFTRTSRITLATTVDKRYVYDKQIKLDTAAYTLYLEDLKKDKVFVEIFDLLKNDIIKNNDINTDYVDSKGSINIDVVKQLYDINKSSIDDLLKTFYDYKINNDLTKFYKMIGYINIEGLDFTQLQLFMKNLLVFIYANSGFSTTPSTADTLAAGGAGLAAARAVARAAAEGLAGVGSAVGSAAVTAAEVGAAGVGLVGSAGVGLVGSVAAAAGSVPGMAAAVANTTKNFNNVIYNSKIIKEIIGKKCSNKMKLSDYKNYLNDAAFNTFRLLQHIINVNNNDMVLNTLLVDVNLSTIKGGGESFSQIDRFIKKYKLYNTSEKRTDTGTLNKLLGCATGEPETTPPKLARLNTFGGSPAEEEPEPAASAPPSEQPAKPPRKLNPTEQEDLKKKALILKKLLYLATFYNFKGPIHIYNKDYLKNLIEKTIPNINAYELMVAIEHFDYINKIYDEIKTNIESLENILGKTTIIFNNSDFNANEIEHFASVFTSGTKPDDIRNELINILKKIKLDKSNKIKEANQVLFKIVGVKSVRSLLPITLSIKEEKTRRRKRAAGGAAAPAPPPRATAQRAAEPTAADTITEAEAEEEAAKAHAEDPDIGPNIDKVDLRDRGIFVVLLFIIRALALFMTEWAVYSGYVNTFSQTFNMYFGVYLCIFILILILTNVKSEISFFEQAFYYVNAEAEKGKGTLRIILQLMCIIFILPIPYMVKDFRLKDTVKTRVLTYTEKSNIYYSVEKFSLYTWILTCIFALIV
jgi:hypothetical protein